LDLTIEMDHLNRRSTHSLLFAQFLILGLLLQEFVGLESVEMACNAYEAIRDMWPSDGTASEQGLRNAISVAEIAPPIAHEQLVKWTLLKETLAASRNEFHPR
jgi:hypothetical protein